MDYIFEIQGNFLVVRKDGILVLNSRTKDLDFDILDDVLYLHNVAPSDSFLSINKSSFLLSETNYQTETEMRSFCSENLGNNSGGNGTPLTKTAVETLGFVDQTQTEQIAATAAANAALTPEKQQEIVESVSNSEEITQALSSEIKKSELNIAIPQSLSANKFNVKNSINGYTVNGTSSNTLTPTASTNSILSGLIKVNPNTTYIFFNFVSFVDRGGALGYTKAVDPVNGTADEYIPLVRGNGGTASFYLLTTSASTEYVQLSVSNSLTGDISRVMFSEGTERPPFEEFKPYITSIAGVEFPSTQILKNAVARPAIELYKVQDVPFELFNGRWTAFKNFNESDTNSNFRKTGKLDFKEGEIIRIEVTRATGAAILAFDKSENPILNLEVFNEDANFNALLNEEVELNETHENLFVRLPKGTDFIAFSSTTGNMLVAKVYKINSIGNYIKNSLDDLNQFKENVSLNLFDPTDIIENTTIKTDGRTVVSANNTVSRLVEIPKDVKDEGQIVFFNFPNFSPRRIAFYNEDGSDNAVLEISNGAAYNYRTPNKLVSVPSFVADIPENAFYFRYHLHAGQSNYALGLDTFKIFKPSDYSQVVNGEINSTENYTGDQIKKVVKSTTHQVVDLSDKVVGILGSSLSGRDNGYGGWVRQFDLILRPKTLLRYASGGATISDTRTGLFGDQYIADDPNDASLSNTYIRKCEELIRDYNDGLIEKPDYMIIEGCTNDFDQNRFVTSSEVRTRDYDEYIENTFFTNTGEVPYATYELIDLQTINRGKIIGAMRYIIERLFSEFPDCKFVFLTPIQSASHNKINQRKCRNELIYGAERLNIPVIDQWGSAGTPMLLDYPGNGSNKRWFPDGDGVHPFSNASGVLEAADVHGRFVVNEFINKFQFFETKNNQ